MIIGEKSLGDLPLHRASWKLRAQEAPMKRRIRGKICSASVQGLFLRQATSNPKIVCTFLKFGADGFAHHFETKSTEGLLVWETGSLGPL
jgi:hypothetical protein